MAIVGCHLAAHEEQISSRIKEVKEIMNMRIDDNTLIYDHDSAIIMGDMNFRVEANDPLWEHYLHNQMWEHYASEDQLTKNKRTIFHNFTERPLDYPPTFKLNPGTDV